jgi:glycosyltransferase involved in cell wall biosynthesis
VNKRISIITACFNSEKTIRATIESVIAQKIDNLEYIIIDGGSTDNTIQIISEYKNVISKVISESDFGIYDAINKGIKIAKGDIIGLLNSDDIFADDMVLNIISNFFSENPEFHAVIGDVQFVNGSGKVVRNYSSKTWTVNKFKWGYMPPHPSFFCKRDFFNLYGYYSTKFKIASDYELLIRFLKVNNLKFKYLSLVTTKMKLGGISTKGLSSTLLLNSEILEACKMNNIKTNYIYIYSKYLHKIFEFLRL